MIVKIIMFFLALTILVTIHEFGHFITARMFKIRVEKFYIFFDAWFSLFKFKKGDTEYGLGWLPLGGYCKISGMVDESLDTESLKSEPQPYEFRAQPAWKRFIVLVAGVTMNVVLAYFIYTGLVFAYGTSYIANEDVKAGYTFNEQAHSLGFVDGDIVMAVGGEKIEKYNDIFTKVIFAEGDQRVDVVRNNEHQQFTIDYATLNELRSNATSFEGFITPRMEFVIDSLATPSAIQAGFEKGDKVARIGDTDIDNYFEAPQVLQKYRGTTVPITVIRNYTDLVTLATPIDSLGRIGVVVANTLIPRTQQYTLLEAFPAGAKQTWAVLKNYWDQLCLIVKPETGLYKQVGGFIAIGSIFPDTWDWNRFWSMTAFLSLILAVMNIIPIPGLDGGHTIFTLYEMITRHKVSDRVIEVAQYIGMFLLFALLIFANGNDVYKLFM